MRLWWQDQAGNLVPGVALCPAGCEAPLQRTSSGRLGDGIRAHLSVVHPGWRAGQAVSR